MREVINWMKLAKERVDNLDKKYYTLPEINQINILCSRMTDVLNRIAFHSELHEVDMVEIETVNAHELIATGNKVLENLRIIVDDN